MTIRDYFKLSDSELDNISNEEIRDAEYGIKYFDFGAAGIRPTERDWQVMDYLRGRLEAIEQATEKSVARTTEKLLICDCGHSVPRELVMSASIGTSCPDCYDEMSC